MALCDSRESAEFGALHERWIMFHRIRAPAALAGFACYLAAAVAVAGSAS